jgi:hypothetical protein
MDVTLTALSSMTPYPNYTISSQAKTKAVSDQ